MKNLLVIFGGCSSEYEVSLRSSASVLRNINRDKYNVYTLGITKDGRWLFYDGDIDSIENNSWAEKNTVSAIISPDKKEKSLLVFKGENIEKIKIDIIFPVMHGKNGEDGTMQGLLTIAGIPYVGPALGIAAAAAAIASGIANVKTILSTKVSATETSVSLPSGSAVTPPALSTPPIEYTRNLLGNKETDELNKPTKVYVLESDITDAQNRVKVTEDNASF